MSISATVFTNARLMDPASNRDHIGSLRVEGGNIAELGPDVATPNGAEIVDCQGRILCPGLIDAMAFRYDNHAALAGGITGVGLMPNQTPALDNEAMITHVARRDAGCVHVYPIGAATRGLNGEQMAEMGLMAAAGAVAVTDGRQAVAPAALMRQILTYAKALDLPFLQHAEEASLSAGGAMNEGETATRLGLSGIPTIAEAIQVDRDIHLVRLTGARLHFLLLSTGIALDSLKRARADRLPVSAGLSPAYFTLNETAIEDYRTFTKLSPPLRAEEDRQACVQALADGTVTIICSAHDPKDQESKRLPFEEAAVGAIGSETLLPLALALHHKGEVPLMTLLRALTCGPADLLGVEGGRLTVGAPADLALIDPDIPWQITPEALVSATKNTPFDGLPVQGRVMRTIIGGQTVYEHGKQRP